MEHTHMRRQKAARIREKHMNMILETPDGEVELGLGSAAKHRIYTLDDDTDGLYIVLSVNRRTHYAALHLVEFDGPDTYTASTGRGGASLDEVVDASLRDYDDVAEQMWDHFGLGLLESLT